MENTGLVNALNNKHGSENVPPTRAPGSAFIDYVLVSEGLIPHITSIGMLSQDAVVASDHISFFMDLDAISSRVRR
jgi:endonuclease/exonuclease/phosphatase family metal-dependent hydrolase